jgi:hypothetical protein
VLNLVYILEFPEDESRKKQNEKKNTEFLPKQIESKSLRGRPGQQHTFVYLLIYQIPRRF